MKNYGLLGLAALLGGVGLFFQYGEGDGTSTAIKFFLAGGLALCAQLILVSTRKGVLATALFAAGCNGYLLYNKFTGAGYAACGTGGGCGAINDSAASELFGLPVTLYGVAFYAGLALASLGSEERTSRFNQVNGVFAIASLVFSVYLGIEAVRLGEFCAFCVAIYGANGLLLWSALKGLRENDRTFGDGLDQIFGTSSFWVVASAFALITLVGASSWNGLEANQNKVVLATKEGRQTLKPQDLSAFYKAPKGEIRLTGTEPVLGNRNAPIKVLEFADYGCPHCAQASPALKQIVEQNPEVQLLFKVFPLSGACNPGLEGEEGAERCAPALAAQCAGDQGRYFEMSSKLFANLGYWSEDELTFMANEAGVDVAAWTACMGNPAALEAVKRDAMAGIDARVMATPTMFVQGLVGEQWVEVGQPDHLLALVEAKRDGVPLAPPSR